MNSQSQQDSIWNTDQVNAIVADLAQLRLTVDLELVPKYPYIGSKIYPLGRCREIRDAVFALLEKKLPTATEPGLVLLRDRLAQGDKLRKVWGALRGVYFQNAIAIGDWYLDVSNDTVNPNKPRIEVLPLAQSGLAHITSFEQFVPVARSYWEVTVYRNEVCPALAPYLPLLFISKSGMCWIGDASDDMLAVATNSQFVACESILATLPPPPPEASARWREALSAVQQNDFLHQQGDALRFCELYRNKGYHQDSRIRDSAVMAYLTLPKGVSLAPKAV